MINISQAGSDTTSITLSPEQGKRLREIIEQNIDCRFSTYVMKVGLTETNVHSILRGSRKVSVKTLTRLLSCCPLELECLVEFQIRKVSGEPAQDVSSQSLEEMLLEEIGEELEEEALTEEESPSTGKANQTLLPFQSQDS